LDDPWHGWLFLLFFAADQQPSTFASRRNPALLTVRLQKNSQTLAVLPLFFTAFANPLSH